MSGLLFAGGVFFNWFPFSQSAAISGYPAKPSHGIAYLNLTDLKYLDPIGEFEIKRGQDLVRAEFAIVILPQLPDNTTIEDYAAGLFKAWDIGRKNNGRGILYVLIQDKGLLKIETSYELESVFPDIFFHSYQDTIKEFFKNNQLGDALSHLVVEMIHRIQDPNYEMSLYEVRDAAGNHLSGGGGISEEGYLVSRISKNMDLTDSEAKRFEKYAKAETPQEAVDKFLSAMKEGISSPYLGILTEGSQYMAMEYHRSSGYQKNRFKQYQRSLPYEIYQEGQYAVARFAKNYVRPLFLRQTDQGLWLVDETKMWAYVDGFAESDGDHYYVQSFDNPSPWSFAVNFPGDTLIKGLTIDRPNPIPLTVNLKELIAALESRIKADPTNASAYFELADVLFFENYWIKDAITAVEKGLALDPLNERYLRRAIFFGSKMPDYTYTPAHFETLLKMYLDENSNPKPGYKKIKYYSDCFKKSKANCSVWQKL